MGRVVAITVLKTMGVFYDKKTDYLVDNGTDMNTGYTSDVSMAQELSRNDWNMETFGLTVSFSLYGDLSGISDWALNEQAKCIYMGNCPLKEIVGE